MSCEYCIGQFRRQVAPGFRMVDHVLFGGDDAVAKLANKPPQAASFTTPDTQAPPNAAPLHQ